jgi:hypothetical protein
MPIPTRSDLITWLQLIGEQVLTNNIIPIIVQKQAQQEKSQGGPTEAPVAPSDCFMFGEPILGRK